MTTHKITGYALMLGAVLYFIANGILTPLLPQSDPWTDTFASTEFLGRLSVAAASVFFLLVGSIGVYNHQSHKTGWYGAIAFGVTFAGSVFIFAHEWAQVFFLHELAIVAPEGLQALEDNAGLNLYDIETLIALTTFMFGWLLFSVSILLARVFSPAGPALLIGGLVSVPILAASLPGLWGFVVGNFIIALGFFALGHDLSRADK